MALNKEIKCHPFCREFNDKHTKRFQRCGSIYICAKAGRFTRAVWENFDCGAVHENMNESEANICIYYT